MTTQRSGVMSRNLYVLAASFLFLSFISCGMAFLPNPLQPGLPVNGSLWKMLGLVLFVIALVSALAAVLTNMFEQVERRNQERMRRELQRDLAELSRHKTRK